MDKIPKPIFHKDLSKISWKKIYAREYGVQYSEMAILCLSPRARHHIPHPSVNQIVIPEGNNTAFYIDKTSWDNLVNSLNSAYTSNLQKLKSYENQFIRDGENYLAFTQKLVKMNLKKLTNKKLCILYQDYQEKLFNYSIFAWTAYILNNYVAERAAIILDKYLKKNNREVEKQDILTALFLPQKKAAVIALQEDAARCQGKLTVSQFNTLYEKYKWLSCLDIHNKPWTKQEFKNHLKSLLISSSPKKKVTFTQYAKQFDIEKSDLEYLFMAQYFVYIKDARDDYRRHGVFYALKFFKEIGRRMGIKAADTSFLQASEVVAFLSGKQKISQQVINNRKKAFVLYLDKTNNLVCLSGKDIALGLKEFRLFNIEEKIKQLSGTVASKGNVRGRVAIVKGIKDLNNVKQGNILVAITTHPDYVPAMRRAAGIVTDEGGITSHAAIVSREFHIPCIVGTKQATKILRDKDFIELDSDKGIIKILKKS